MLHRGKSPLATAFAAALFFAGCGSPPPPFLEAVRIDEALTEADLGRLAAVLEAIGTEGREALPSPYLPPPDWSAGRTLPVRELADAERRASDRAWSAEAAAKRLHAGPTDRALARYEMTRRQLCALVLAAGAAASRDRIAAGTDLADLARRGAVEAAAFAADERPFASLPVEEQAAVLRRAAWLTIGDRATRLAAVPPENVVAVARHAERLGPLLPAAFLADPFAGLYPRAEDLGVPFLEGEISDRDLNWQPPAPAGSTDSP